VPLEEFPGVPNISLIHWCRKLTTVNAESDAEETEHPLKSSAKNMQSNEWPFNGQEFCRVDGTFHGTSERLYGLSLYHISQA